MRFTRHQIKVLTVLHLVVAVMLLGVILMPKGGNGGTDSPVQGEPQVPSDGNDVKPQIHDRFRDPRIAFDEDIFWETNIGGSGDEQVENAYEIQKKLYIIGNTNSKDLDFDGADGGIYLTVLSENGKPLAYYFYDGELIKSALHKDGIFCLARRESKFFALVIDTNGVLKTEKELPLKENENPVDFILNYETDGAVIIIEAETELPPQKRVQVLSLDASFDPTDGLVLQNSFPLEYVAALPRADGYMIAANISGAKTGELVIYEWKTSADKLYSLHEFEILNRKYRAVDFMPYSGGYVSLMIDENGVADLYTMDYEFKNTKIIILGAENATGGRLFSDNAKNYVFLQRANGTSAAYEMPLDLSDKTEIASLSTQTEITAFRATQTDAYFGGKNAFSPVISVLNNQGVLFEKAFGSVTETVKVMLPSDGFIFVICESRGTSQNVGKNFGGSDILIVKLRF